jgi:hypothetical protein
VRGEVTLNKSAKQRIKITSMRGVDKEARTLKKKEVQNKRVV